VQETWLQVSTEEWRKETIIKNQWPTQRYEKMSQKKSARMDAWI